MKSTQLARQNKVTIKVIKQYLDDGGSKNRIAEFMGYETGTTIHQWIKRNSIPGHATKRLLEFFKKEKYDIKN